MKTSKIWRYTSSQPVVSGKKKVDIKLFCGSKFIGCYVSALSGERGCLCVQWGGAVIYINGSQVEAWRYYSEPV